MRIEEGKLSATTDPTLGANPLTQYYLTSFNGPMLNSQVVVIFGRIDHQLDYWSFCPYLMKRRDKSYLASLNDTLNNFEVGLSSFALFVSRNPLAIREIQDLFREYRCFFRGIPDIVEDEDVISILGRVTSEVPISLNTLHVRRYTVSGPVESYKLGRDILLKPKVNFPDEHSSYLFPFHDYIRGRLVGLEIKHVQQYQDFLGGGVYSGFDAIITGQNAILDNRDTSYKVAADIPLMPGQLCLVFGINHRVSGKGIYTNNSIYHDKDPISGITFRDNQETFYTMIVGYESTLQHLNIPDTEHKIIVPDSVTQIRGIERCYLQLPQNVAPASSSIISPIIVIV